MMDRSSKSDHVPGDIETNSYTGTKRPARATQERIASLLDSLPAESLAVVERLVEFLHEQAQQGEPVVVLSQSEEVSPYHYPTVPMPPSALDSLVGIMPPVGGDALFDTEAPCDSV